MIGNDIIDRSRLPIGEGDRFRRYWEKSLHPDEYLLAPTPLLRWALWAAKESAYKLEGRLGLRRRFWPAHYVAEELERQDPYLHGRIRGRLGVCSFGVEVRPQYLLATCWLTGDHPPASKVAGRATSAHPSQAVRALLQEVVRTHFPPSRPWRLSAPAGRMPMVVAANHSQRIPVSFSHHGAYVAVAWPSQYFL